MTHVVLDASAILALLTGERGAGKVAGAIADASVCAVNQAEVISHFVHLGAPPVDVRSKRIIAADAIQGPDDRSSTACMRGAVKAYRFDFSGQVEQDPSARSAR